MPHDPPLRPPGAPDWHHVAWAQPGVWLVFGLIYFALDRGRQGVGLDAGEQLYLLIRAGAWAATGASVSVALSVLYSRIPERTRWLVAALVGLPLGAAAWMLVFQTLDALPGLGDDFYPPWAWRLDHLFGEYTDHFLSLGAWTGLVFSMAARWRASEAQVRAAEAESAANAARLEALRHQLSPHFLFNSLNTSIALVSQDPDHAEEVLTELAALLRQTLTLDIADTHTLRDELGLTRRYLGLAQVRFADDLEVEEHIDQGALSANVPVFALQALVDNAVKHGINTSPMPLRITLEAHARDGGLWLRVRNTGALGTPSEGRGLAILRAQLKPLGGTLSLAAEEGAVSCALWVPQ